MSVVHVLLIIGFAIFSLLGAAISVFYFNYKRLLNEFERFSVKLNNAKSRNEIPSNLLIEVDEILLILSKKINDVSALFYSNFYTNQINSLETQLELSIIDSKTQELEERARILLQEKERSRYINEYEEKQNREMQKLVEDKLNSMLPDMVVSALRYRYNQEYAKLMTSVMQREFSVFPEIKREYQPNTWSLLSSVQADLTSSDLLRMIFEISEKSSKEEFLKSEISKIAFSNQEMAVVDLSPQIDDATFYNIRELLNVMGLISIEHVSGTTMWFTTSLAKDLIEILRNQNRSLYTGTSKPTLT